MSITVEFKDFNEMVAFAKQLIGEPAEVKQKDPVKKPVPSENKTVITGAPEDVKGEVPVEEEETKNYTLEEVRAELARATRSGKQKEVKALLTSFGAKNLSGVDAKDYAALMEKAGAL